MRKPNKSNLIILGRNLILVLLCFLALAGSYSLKMFFVSNLAAHKDILISNADSLVLPLLENSILHGYAIEWIFSSQLFLFPEALLYLFSTLFSSDFKMTLIINGLLNITAIWLLITYIFRKITSQKVTTYMCFYLATLTTSGLVFLSTLEQSPLFFITQFFTTTYYGGAIICGFGIIAVALAQLNENRNRYLVISFFISTLGVFSNPLLAIQFILPLMLIVLSGYLLAIINAKQGIKIFIGPALGLATGLFGRKIFSSFIETDVGKYYQPAMVPQTLGFIKKYVSEASNNPFQLIQFLIVGSLFAIIIYLFLSFIRLYSKRSSTLSINQILQTKHTYFLLGFGTITPAVTIVVTLLSGNYSPRYFLPIFILPFIVLALIFFRGRTNSSGRYMPHILLALIFMGLVTVNGVISLGSHKPDDVACFDRMISSSYAKTGVASFWNARKFHLYNQSGKEILQIYSTGEVYPHLNNLAEYRDKKMSFVIVDNKPSQPADLTSTQVISRFGNPSSIDRCPTFSIFYYQPEDSSGAKLNDVIRTSLDAALKARHGQ